MPQAGMSQRFGRQYGLVRQDRVENLNILINGDNELLPYLLMNLALSGVGALQGGVYLYNCSSTVEARHVNGQFLLRRDDVSRSLIEALRERLGGLYPLFDLQLWPEHAFESIVPDVTVILPVSGVPHRPEPASRGCQVFGQIGPSSVYIGHEPIIVDRFEPNIFGAALASFGGAALAQDVLRLSNSLRSLPVLEQIVELSLRVRSRSVVKYFGMTPRERLESGVPFAARLKLGGEHLQARGLFETEASDEGILRLELPRDGDLSRFLLDSVDIVEEPLDKRSGILPPLFFSLLGDDRLEQGRIVPGPTHLPARLERLKPLIVGVGGLGTWVAGLLAASPIGTLDFAIVDSDTLIEEHNLNRQVLYSSRDLGRPKADAAADSLMAIKPECAIHQYPLHLKEDLALYLDRGVEADYADPSSIGPTQGAGDGEVDRESLLLSMLARDIRDADVAISCLDNMQSRWILNVLASLVDLKMVNGGVTGFIGSADFMDGATRDATLVTRYGAGIKTDVVKVQCGGSIPIPSIATTNALIGSVQAAYALAGAAGLRPANNYLYFDGTSRNLYTTDFLEESGADSLGAQVLLDELRALFGVTD